MVLFPLKFGAWYSVQKVRTLLGNILVVNACLIVPQINELSSFRTLNGIKICTASDYYLKVYAFIENSFYIYIPMAIVVVGNIMIISKISFSANSRMVLTQNKETSCKRLKEHRRITRVLVAVASAFVVLHLPQVLAKIGQALYTSTLPCPNEETNWRAYFIFEMFVSLGYQITDFQNSINFFLYCAFGTKTRKALTERVFYMLTQSIIYIQRPKYPNTCKTMT